MTSSFRCVAVFAILAAGRCARGAPAAGGGLRVSDPRCEFDAAPTGIDTPRPRLSWVVAGSGRGERQTAWEVVAATSAARLAPGTADLWDSGRVSSDETEGILFAGAALASSERVFWKVRVWDREERPSSWSEPAAWTMGLLEPSDWRGIWIAAPGATESLLLRREFRVRRGLKRAVVHVSGLGQYVLFLNGVKVGRDLLSPGWTTYGKTVLYDTREVAHLLHEGRNAVGILLGNGIYDVVRRDRFVKFEGFTGPLRAILHLRLEYDDGTVEFLGTDERWRSHPGPITTGNIYSGEDFDARLEPDGWTRAGFADGSWSRAVACRGAGTEVLRGHGSASEPLRAIEENLPVAVKRLPDGTAVYDFGQNASHMPRIRVSGPAGSVVRLTPSEVVNPDGTINRNTMDGKNRGNAWWQYTKATDGEESWFPDFYYVGCRYIKVEGFASQADLPLRVPAEDSTERSVPGAAPRGGDPSRLPRVDSIAAVVVHSDAAPVGRFAASNELLNRIRELVRWAQRSNMVSVLTDCPHREKLGWLEQYHLNGPALRYEFDATRIFSKGVHDMADAQTADGLVPNIAPEYTRFEGTFRAAAEWGAAFILVPWQQYEFTGDDRLIRDHYAEMKRYFGYLRSRADDGILSEGLGDWFDLGPAAPGPAQLTPPPVTATAFYCEDAKILSREAAVLGLAGEEGDFAGQAGRIRASFNRRFYHADSATYGSGSQCAEALALVFDLAVPADRPRVLASLVKDVEAHGCSMTTGDIGFRFLLQALARGGRSDLVYRMIDQDRTPGYGYELRMGATSLTESWDANLNTSHDHFMLGQITEWFYRDLAGIDGDPEGPGFKRIVIRPSPVGDLAWVDAAYDSIRGPIAVRWERSSGRFVLKASIPANTTATVFVPVHGGGAVLEGGTPAGRSPGVAFLRREDDRAVFAVESGDYAFESPW